MNWEKRIVGVGLVVLSVSACGFLGSAGGGGSDGGGSPGNPENTPAPEGTPAPNADAQKLDVPLAVRSLDELMKDIGASDFVALQAPDDALYSRVKEVEDFSGHGSFTKVIGDTFVYKDGQGVPSSCTAFFTDSLRFIGQNIGFLYQSSTFTNGFRDKLKLDGASTSEISPLPKFSSIGIKEIKTETLDQSKRTEENYVGIADDLVVQGLVSSKYVKEKLDTLLNCARIYNKTTHVVKTSCSWASVAIGRSAQFNDITEESYLPNQYSFKDTHTLLVLANSDDRVTTVTTYTQKSSDTVDFDILDQASNKPDAHVTGTMKITAKSGSDRTCDLISGSKL